MKIAVVGGTGSFGKALAARAKAAGHKVVVGSRDAERARAAGEELGVAGAQNAEAVTGVDLVVLAVKADGMLDTAEQLADAIGATPVLSVGAELAFAPDGRSALHREAGTRVQLVEITALDVSASEIRSRLREGRSVRYLLPEAVREAVIASGAYGTEWRR